MERALYDRDGPPDTSWLHRRQGYIILLNAQLAEHHLRAAPSNNYTEATVIGMNMHVDAGVHIIPAAVVFYWHS